MRIEFVFSARAMAHDALMQPESRAAFRTILHQGWTDAIRHLHPDETIYTFWDYFRDAFGRNAGLRIDHFLLNGRAMPRLKSGGVDKHVRGWEKSSDHAPVWVELADKPRKGVRRRSAAANIAP